MSSTIAFDCDGCSADVEVVKPDAQSGIVTHCPYCGKVQSDDVDS